MGYLYIMVVERMVWPAELKPLLMTGFLGAFTTFSAFSLEAWELFERGEWLMALAYILASVVLCIVGLGIGVMMARYTV